MITSKKVRIGYRTAVMLPKIFSPTTAGTTFNWTDRCGTRCVAVWHGYGDKFKDYIDETLFDRVGMPVIVKLRDISTASYTYRLWTLAEEE